MGFEGTYFSGALNVLCVATDKAGVLHVVCSVGLSGHDDVCVFVWWCGIDFDLE